MIYKSTELLPTNYKAGQREHSELSMETSRRKVNLFSKGKHLLLAEYKCAARK